jgi:hypothetical protein
MQCRSADGPPTRQGRRRRGTSCPRCDERMTNERMNTWLVINFSIAFTSAKNDACGSIPPSNNRTDTYWRDRCEMLHEVLLFADTCRKRLSMSFPRLFVFILDQLLLLLGRLPLLLGRLLLQRQSPDTMDERVLPHCCTWDTGPGDRRGFASIGQNIWHGSNGHSRWHQWRFRTGHFPNKCSTCSPS